MMNEFTTDVYTVLKGAPMTDEDLATLLDVPTWRVRNARRYLRHRGLVVKIGRRVNIRTRSRRYHSVVWGSPWMKKDEVFLSKDAKGGE